MTMCILLDAGFCFRYTAVGVFVLGRMFREVWGAEAAKKQSEFNAFIEVICASKLETLL